MTRKAVYAASLDPITNGHVNVIERSAGLFHELVIVVSVDTRKKYTFTPDERVTMARITFSHLQNVSVEACIGQYVVRFADSLGAKVIIRGIRNFQDLAAEQTLAEENRRICPGIETMFIPCLPELMHVSSSMVKGHVGVDPGWEAQVARSVPPAVVAKLKEKFVAGEARKYWEALTAGQPGLNDPESVFQNLLALYSEPHRAYHNLEHIVNMLEELGHVDAIENRDSVTYAVWFHDAIYDSRAKDNEEQSAALAQSDMRKIGLPNAMAERVAELILATKHDAPPTDTDSKLLVDLDLAILGKPQAQFDAYETAIRKEYDWVPREDFIAGRTQIIQSFLERATIYNTRQFQNQYEATARVNLQQALEALQLLNNEVS